MITARPGVMPRSSSASTRVFHFARTSRATAFPSMSFAVMMSGAETRDDEEQHAGPHESITRGVQLLRARGADHVARLEHGRGRRRDCAEDREGNDERAGKKKVHYSWSLLASLSPTNRSAI